MLLLYNDVEVKRYMISYPIKGGYSLMNQDEKIEQLNIFLVEDETELNRNLITIFRDNGWSVRGYLTYKSAYMALKNEKPACSMFLLDVILPDGSGYELCRHIRESYGSDVIIIFITGCDDEESLIKGFDAGADDYIRKPFMLTELFARIKAHRRKYIALNRISHNTDMADNTADADDGLVLKCSNITIRQSTCEVKVDNARLELRRTEYKLLCYFVKNQGLLLRRTQILNALWDSSEEYVDDRTLTVAISRLRERLRFFNTNVNIETVRGIGYRLSVKDYLQ